jgi:hypothetical protein
MKVGKVWAAVGLSFVAACGGGGGGGGGSGGGGDPPTCGSPGQPPCATGGTTPLKTAHNYAIHQLFLGDIDPATGKQTNTAWQNYGYDLDGKNTTVTSTDVCTQVTGALAREQVDGPNGIDNSFGENLLPIIVQLDPTASTTVNSDINEGKFTVMFDVTGFDDAAGNTTSATGLSGVILAGADVSNAGAPTWTPTYTWPVRPELLDCSPSCAPGTDPAQHADIKFMGAYQSAGTFVSGAPTELTISLPVGGQPIQLKVHSALVTFEPESPGHVRNGMIAGVLQTSDVLSEIQKVVGYLAGGSLCSGAALAQIENEINFASDVVVSGDTVSNDPGTICNGITIGLGFTADEIAPPSAIAPAAAAGTNPCDMAGAGGG